VVWVRARSLLQGGVFQEPAHLFDIKNTTKWSRLERRGDTLGEMARADNPAVGCAATIRSADRQK
jgi:hypothetical protein